MYNFFHVIRCLISGSFDVPVRQQISCVKNILLYDVGVL